MLPFQFCYRMEKSLEVDKMKNGQVTNVVGSKQSQEENHVLVTEERETLLTEVHEHQSHAVEVEHLQKRCNDMASHLNFFISLAT